MLKIGICIQDKKFERHVVRLVKGMLLQQETPEFESIPVEALLNKNSEMFSGYPVIIIDEQLFHKEGVQTVQYLTRIRPDVEIILVEGEKEDTVSGLRYHVFAYQMKRLKQRELSTAIVDKLRQTTENPQFIVIRFDGEEISIPVRDIMYAESRNRHIILHTVMGEYEYSEKMYTLESVLVTEGFVRCHQSYIVSKKYVTDIDSNGIWLEQECIPVGRTYKDIIRNELSDVADSQTVNDTKTEKQGALLGVRGLYDGAVFNFRPEERIIIGRSEKAADLRLELPLISRMHCMIIYHDEDDCYEVVDFSKNGTFLKGKKRLAPDTGYILKLGEEISFGDCDNVYRLG